MLAMIINFNVFEIILQIGVIYFSNQNSNMVKLTKGRLALNNRYYIFKCGKGC